MKIVEKLGRAGNKQNRDQKRNEWDLKYGEENWKVVYQYNNKVYSRDNALIEFYNKSYFIFLKNNPKVLDELCSTAKIIYNPHALNTGGVDLQCPAVLDSLQKLNKKLEGTERIAIGTWGKGRIYPQISKILSPYNVPLWCNKSISVETFWQEYKYLIVKE